MAAGKRLQGDPGLRRRAGASARSYAESTFDIGQVADAFMSIMV